VSQRASTKRIRGRIVPIPHELPFEITESKLLPPPIRPGLVSRLEVVDRLRASRQASVVAISAPSGYGKTSLLVDWAEHERRPFAWVSIDETDNDPLVLLAHVAVALHRVEPAPDSVFAALGAPGASIPGTVGRRVGAAFSQRKRPVVLVLDDVDYLTEPLCVDAVVSLAAHIPAGSQLAVTGRSLRTLPLSRLRSEGRLLEVGVKDLALDGDGAHQLLRGAGANVSRAKSAELAESTEGWPVGLYLAALSLQAQSRASVPAIRFTGDDRFITDYVRSEFLSRLPRERVRFLLRTSVLDQLSGSLCDAVLERKGSARALESMEESNLLLVPLDRDREWYRFHHLFRDVLRSELRHSEPDAEPDLHRRAADWFEANGMIVEAMEHARGGDDTERVARLFQQHIFPLNRSGRFATLHRWLGYLGTERVAKYPSLAVTAAWVAVLSGEPRSAERWADLALAAPAGWAPSDGSATARSALAMMRALLCRRGPEAMLEDARLAIEEEPPTSPWRPAALSLSGLASIALGDLAAADHDLREAAETGVEFSAIPVASLAFAERSLIATALGEREAAAAFAQRADQLVRSSHLEEYATSIPSFAATARVALRNGDQAGAREAIVLAQRARWTLTYAIPTVAVQTRLELAHVHLGLSDVAGARTLLAEVDEIMQMRPDLGVLTDQTAELRAQMRAFGGGRAGGPSTLTGAELRLLSVLPTYLSFREIGARLFVSPNTVKTQAISIYRKLGVSSRSAAVETARELGLLEA
jgi:LuxR family transcriptional regulator, maltose regulon positive regulatory protein